MDTRAAWLIDIDAQVNEHVLHLDDQHLKFKFKSLNRSLVPFEPVWGGKATGLAITGRLQRLTTCHLPTIESWQRNLIFVSVTLLKRKGVEREMGRGEGRKTRCCISLQESARSVFFFSRQTNARPRAAGHRVDTCKQPFTGVLCEECL